MEKTPARREALRIDDLAYAVGSRSILDGVSLRVADGEFVGLIGPNGSGKTTLLRHVYRALPPERATVYVHGRDIRELTYRDSAREITVMRQENGTDFPYTILEMVLMGRSPHHRFYEGNTARDREMAMDALTRVGMDGAADRQFGSLSGGEKQRVLMARSLTQGADVLLLDEPTNHLDVYYQWSIMGAVRELGKTVLAVFHELNLACAFCDRIYVLRDHGVVAGGPPVEVVTRELLAEVFRVDAEVLPGPGGRPRILYNGAIGQGR